MAEFATSIDIEAPPSAVYDYLTTNEGMTSWMGDFADLDPRAGGRFAVNIAGHPVRGEFVLVEPAKRIVVTWGFAGDDDLPPGASTVEFSLTPIERGTRVDLVHSGLPDEFEGISDGWDHFVPRLAAAVTGQRFGHDTWRPTPDRARAETSHQSHDHHEGAS